MHVLMPVFYRAAQGGLHEHVAALTRAILSAGWECTLVCRDGTFAARMESSGCHVHRTDWTDPDRDARTVSAAASYTLVHAHPFAARALGMQVAHSQGIPFLLTIHGMYDDGLASYASDTALVLCVSSAIRDNLAALSGVAPERLLVVPNGVQTQLFYPPDRLPDRAGKPAVLVVSRFHEDKRFIVDVLLDALKPTRFGQREQWDWVFVGEGPLRAELERAARGVRGSVEFVDWQPVDALPAMYRAADVAIAPGRSALEAMACGVPTIAVGSSGYVGFLDPGATASGVYTNFGGFGQRAEGYQTGRLRQDVERALAWRSKASQLGAFYARTIQLYFDQQLLDAEMIRVYEWAHSLGQLASADSHT